VGFTFPGLSAGGQVQTVIVISGNDCSSAIAAGGAPPAVRQQYGEQQTLRISDR